MKKVENTDKNKEEILNNLLKKLLDQKLTKLEKRHKIEQRNIIEMSNTSQNLILSLENMSNNVLKQIYSKRQILINNANKLPKNMKLPKKATEKRLIKTPITQKKNLKLNRIESPNNDRSKKMLTERNRGNKSAFKKDTKNIKKGDKYFNTLSNNKEDNSPNLSRRTISPFIISKKRDELNNTTPYRKNNNNKKKHQFV